MTTEDYVSYPLALALKKHGFDWKCRDFYWTSDGTFKHPDAPVHKNSEHCTTMVAAPTLWQAQKWLREKRKIDIELWVWVVGDTREYRPYIMPPKKHDFIAYPPEKSYESALSAGIAAALELIERKGE